MSECNAGKFDSTLLAIGLTKLTEPLLSVLSVVSHHGCGGFWLAPDRRESIGMAAAFFAEAIHRTASECRLGDNAAIVITVGKQARIANLEGRGMSLEPEREPVVYPVYRWLEIAHELHKLGDGALAEAIYRAMDARRLSASVAFKLTAEERERVDAAIKEAC